MVLLLLLIFQHELASSSSSYAAAHELTDDAPTTTDEEGFIGNIPLYLAYDIRHGELECLYDKISTPHSYLTSSVYALGNKDGYHGMRAVIVMEGPVAPSGFTIGVITGTGAGRDGGVG